MDNITFTASADSTPPANTVVATKQFGGGEHAQEIILADVDENFFSASGFGASPIVTIVSNLLSASIASGSVTVDKINLQISASVSGGSVALLAGANVFGSASVIQSTPTGIGNAWPIKITDGVDIVGINSSSQLLVAVAAASVNIVDTAGNQYGISAASPMYVTGGAGGTNIADAGAFAEGVTSLTPAGGVYLETTASLTASQVGMFRITASRALHVNLRDASGLQLGVTGSPIVATITSGTVNTISNQISASVSGGSITVDKVNLQVSASISSGTINTISNQVSASIGSGSITVDKVNLVVSTSVIGGSIALLAGTNTIGVASVIQQVTSGWSLSSIYNVVSASISSGSLGGIEKINTPVSASISSGSLGTVEKINTPVSASISSGSITIDKVNLQISASIAAGTINNISNQISASVSAGSITVDKVNLVVSTSVAGGSVALLAGVNAIGIASVIQQVTSGWSLSSIYNVVSASIGSGSLGSVEKINTPVSASISSGSLGAVEKINTPISASISNVVGVSGSLGSIEKINTPVSASISSGSLTVSKIDDTVSASISSGSITVDKIDLQVSASISNIAYSDYTSYSEGASPLVPVGGMYFETAASLTACQLGGLRMTASRALHVNLRDASGLQLGAIGSPLIISGSITVDKVDTQVSASVSSGSITVDKVNLQVSASVSGGSVALLAGANNIGIASVIQQVTDGWSLSSIYNVVSASIGSGSLGSVEKINTPVSASISSGSLGSIEKINTPVSASISNTVAVSGSLGSVEKVNTPVSASISSGSITVDKINLGVSASVSSGSITVDKINLGVSASISNAPSALVSGDLAHDAADAGNPVKVGIRSASFGVKPTAVAHADRSNWYGNVDGIPFVLGGHMAASSKEFAFTTAQNDQALWAASTTNKLVITKAEVTLDEAVTVGVGVRLGFGTNTLSASGTGGASGLVLSHPGLVPGGGITIGDGNGILGAGLNNEAIRFTCEVPTTGAVVVRVTCFEIVA